MTTYFASFSDFLNMNGYAVYVWPVWGLVLGALLLQALSVRKERRRILSDIRRMERRESVQPHESEQHVS